jgi:arylsulfatase A-like enzyme
MYPYRHYIHLLKLTFACLPLAAASSAMVAAESTPPNIILIITDDQRWDAIGYENPFVRTPNMDRFSEQGLRFSQATIVLPVCSPSRAGILTGRYGLANGVTTFHTPLRPGERTFFRQFTQAGYLTAMVGKWHVLPEDAPYPEFGGFMTRQAGGDFPPVFYDFEEIRDLGNSRDYWEPLLVRNGRRERLRGVTTIDYVVDESIALIQQAREEGRPFAIYLSTLEPHNRMWTQGQNHLSETTLEHFRENPLDGMPIPGNINDDLQGKPPYLQTYRGRVQRVGERGQRPVTPERFRDSVFRIYAMMSEVDIAMERLFDLLEGEGLMDNTYVLLMGDNGLFEGEHGFMSKGLHYEPSVRIPFFAVGPGIPAGVDEQSLPTNIDLAPTLLDLAGLDIPANMHGESLKSVLKTGQPLNRDFVLLEHPDLNEVLEVRPVFSLRSKEWKYIRTFEDGRGKPATFEELYHLTADLYEMNNLVGEPQHSERLDSMRAILDAQIREVMH